MGGASDEREEAARRARARWDAEVLAPALAKSPERCERFLTGSSRPVDRLYGPGHRAVATASEPGLGFPGEFPFTRGIHPTQYRGRLWTMRQYAGYGSAEDSNRRYRYLLEQGQNGLSVAFDLPTQVGYDSDHAMCVGEVGKVGVAIDSLEDMERLFDGIPLDCVSTSMTINAPAAVLLAMYVATAERRGVAPAALRGTVQNDILKEYIARGTYIFPPQPSMRLITDIFAYCSEHLPRFNTISISGYHIREAGSTAAQEIALTLADGIAYVEAALAAGLEVDAFASRLSFFFAAHNDLLEETAKFRAARRLWARIMKDRFGARDPASMMLRFHAQTAGSTLTAQQPENNVVRVAMQALAAVLGGSQSIHTNSRDEAYALPTEESVQIALRTQQILAFETGVANTVDPLGGSYCIEALTDEVEAEARALIDRIDAMGGMLNAITAGFPQREIEQSSYDCLRQIERGERIVVGVNKFTSEEAPPAGLLRVDPEIGARQVERLRDLRRRREAREVDASLGALRTAAGGSGNLVPPILDCVRRLATLGEICGVLRDVFGEYRRPEGL